ncbi:MAG: hypothetical protein LPD71_00135 [Shewanella sp.]|nr:hypothetical protein [Shewanella sp.]MCF1459476.1 hypothetical protein [Shewanella sp.]
MTQTQVAYHPFAGGLDLVSPVLNIPPGYLLDGMNYEPDVNGGYRRIPGYERYDGQPSPSNRAHVVLELDQPELFTLGDTLMGKTSQSSGTIVIMENLLVCLCGSDGDFMLEEVTDGQHIATITRLDVTEDSFENYTQEERWFLYENFYRVEINQPPGNAGVEGVCHHQGITYAFRASDNELITISKSTDAGWQEIPQQHYLKFEKAGNLIPEEGAGFTTVNGASATVQRYIRQGGSADDLSVYGYFMVDSIVGTLSDGDRLEVGRRSSGKVEGSGYLTMTVSGIALNALLPAVKDPIKNQGDGVAKVHEAILRKQGASPDTVDCWFLLSDITGTFNDGDQIRRVDPDAAPDAEPMEPFGNVNGKPLPAIHLSDYGDTELEVGDILDMNGQEARVFWKTVYNEVHEETPPESTAKTDPPPEPKDRLYLVLQDLTLTPPIGTDVTIIQIAGYAVGVPEPIQLKAGGVFEFRAWNFFARPEQERIYGCNGQTWAFELNTRTGLICPIIMEDEDPVYPHAVEVHKNHLFLGFPGGSVRHSVIGEPMNFNGQLGAFEVGVGDDVSAMVSHPGEVLAIICRNRIQGLYGNTIDDWQMSLIAENVGGYPRSAQLLQQAYMIDDNGLCQLQRVMEYGNFADSTVSRLVQPLLNQHKTQVTGSTVLRDQNLICMYFKSGYGMSIKPMPGQLPEIMNFAYPTEITCVHHAEDDHGNARVFFGTPDGWVYEDRKGTSFDGLAIESLIRTSYNSMESPTYRKAFKRLELMLSGGYDVYLKVGMELDYSAAYTPQPAIRAFSLQGGQGGYWNEDNWNEFYWSGQDVSTGDVSVSGTGKNYSLMIYNVSMWTSPYTLQGIIVHYIMRRLDRG